MDSRYLDPKNDLAFLKVFGSEKHKNIPINFLNAVFNLQGTDKIVHLDFLNLKQPPEISSRKESVVDVLVRDQAGTKYIVEMQVAKGKGFEKRAQFYAAKTYCSHFKVGGEYHNLKKVIFLAITDYEIFPKKKERYKSDHVVLDNVSYENDLKDFSFTFVELPKFNKKLSELKTIEDRWYYFLKHADRSDNIEEIIKNHPEIKEAYGVLDRYHWTEQELQWYDKVCMNEADHKSIIDAAKEEGMEKGKAEGKAEGEKTKALTIAKKMLSEGFTKEQVLSLTGLTAEDLKKLSPDVKSQK